MLCRLGYGGRTDVSLCRRTGSGSNSVTSPALYVQQLITEHYQRVRHTAEQVLTAVAQQCPSDAAWEAVTDLIKQACHVYARCVQGRSGTRGGYRRGPTVAVPAPWSRQQTEKFMNSKPLGLRQTENSSNEGGVFRPFAAGKVVARDINQRTARGENKIGH